jgi:hypothetical protein
VDLAEAFAWQATHCDRLGSPLYGDLLRRASNDIGSGGPVAQVFPDQQDVRVGDVVALRLLGGIHALVLNGMLPELAMFYPSVGGAATDPDARWLAFRAAVDTHREVLRPWLERAPQTNEVGRAAALKGALLVVANRWPDHAVVLREMGASAGLNLNVDRLPIGPGLTIDSQLPELPNAELRLVDSIGADLHPIDASTPDGQLLLAAYVWPDDIERLARLRIALDIAMEYPPHVKAEPATDFVRDIELRADHVTVLWHSVMWQYLKPAEQAAVRATIDELHRSASDDAPFAYVSLEFDDQLRGRGQAVLSLWVEISPGGSRSLMATAPPHGVPVAWDPLATQ